MKHQQQHRFKMVMVIMMMKNFPHRPHHIDNEVVDVYDVDDEAGQKSLQADCKTWENRQCQSTWRLQRIK